jgi:8-oxo-dGTP diphosphatase
MSIAVAVALILKDGCVLMGERRADKVYPLHWEFPGGKLEPDETAIDALRRELFEELAIGITDAEYWISEKAEYSNGMTYDISYFLVREWKGEIGNKSEFNRIEWVSDATLALREHLSGNASVLRRIEREGIPV